MSAERVIPFFPKPFFPVPFFPPLPKIEPGCQHPSHNAPMGLYIPPGQVVTITCPGCGMKTQMRGSGGIA